MHGGGCFKFYYINKIDIIAATAFTLNICKITVHLVVFSVYSFNLILRLMEMHLSSLL